MSDKTILKGVNNGSNDEVLACLWCGIAIYGLRKGQKYCSPKCRSLAWNKAHVSTFISPDGKMKTTVVVK